MADIEYPHLFLNDAPTAKDYQNPSGGGSDFELPNRPDRVAHANRILAALNQIWAEADAERNERKAVSLPARDGSYIEFESSPGFDLKFESLEARTSGIRLLNVREHRRVDGETVQRATIYVPKGKGKVLFNKITRYRDEQTPSNAPKHKNLVESLNGLRAAILQSFWNDLVDLIPPTDAAKPCEIWLRVDSNHDSTIARFRTVCQKLNIPLRESFILFPERAVMLVEATSLNLEELISTSDDVAEFRLAKETADFWTELPNADQAEWMQDLASRLSLAPASTASVCIVDTGATNGHPLLAPLLSDEDCHSVNAAEWGTSDDHGHGTAMCGTAAFADNLTNWLQTADLVQIPFQLESVKLIPSTGHKSPKDLYGERTLNAVSRAEIQNPEKNRVVCLAITSEDDRDRGRPSSWSGALDKLISGFDDDAKRLVIVAAGNVADPNEWKNYPDSNITNTVHDPAQAWNALTVGAVTFLDEIHNEEMAGTYTPIAGKGQLSPYSTTSMTWENRWPNKPDIVMEGGNIGIDGQNFTTQLSDLSLLTLGHQPQKAVFDTNFATSAAAGLAAELSARLWSQYPNAWPETIRGLIVHSADWSDALKQQFYEQNKPLKHNRERLLRVCGYGVPDINRAIASAENSLTLIAEQEIQPFCPKNEGSNDYKAKDMHLYDLPWPKEALLDIPGHTPVIIDVTLSYFIEPGPGEIGWRDKYRYRSHGLDFNLKRPTETTDEFVARVNKAAQSDDQNFGGGSVDWAIGQQKGRTRGSIHRDWVEMTAAEAADSNVIGIFPRSGWWKERAYLGFGSKKARYSLIISIRVPSTDIEIDIYTPVANKVSVDVPIAV